MIQRTWLGLTVIFAIVTGVWCVKDVKLEILPAVVEHGGEVILRCHYVIENEPIYVLKWYRGKREFYRFTPGGKPTTKAFPIDGIELNLKKSNESQVVIHNVNYNVTGNYSCETTTDTTFETEIGWNRVVVVSLPKSGPVIASEKDHYDPGDTLKANCTVPPSKPPASLSFTLNNKPVGQQRTNYREQKQQDSNYGSNEGLKVDSYNVHQQDEQKHPYGNLQWTELSLPLQPFHYVNGQLTLRCLVLIPEIYNVTVETQLGTGLREPVPERVTSENAATVSRMVSLTLLGLTIVHPLTR